MKKTKILYSCIYIQIYILVYTNIDTKHLSMPGFIKKNIIYERKI